MNSYHTNFRDAGGGCTDDEHCRIDPALMYHLGLLGKDRRRGGRHADVWRFGRYNDSPITIYYASMRVAEEMLALALERLREDDPATYELVWKDRPYEGG